MARTKTMHDVVLCGRDFAREDIWQDLVDAAIEKAMLPWGTDPAECNIEVRVVSAKTHTDH